MTRSLGDVLNDVLARYKLHDTLHKARMPHYWADVVGPRLAALTEVRGLENGVLKVHVRDATWRAELALRREELRTKLNARIGSDMIREIVLR